MKLKASDVLPLQRRFLFANIVRRKKAAAVQGAAADDSPDEGIEEIYDVSLSSEEPVDRWFGREVLDHSAEAVNLARAKDGINLLWNHNTNTPVGRLTNLRADGGKLKAEMRFSQIPAGREKKTLVDEGMREMSIGYSIERYECTPGTAGLPDEYRATSWTPLEGSLVSVPADHTVGVGRGQEADPQFPVLVRSKSPPAAPASPEVRVMDRPDPAADPTAATKTVPIEIARLARQHGMADKTSEWLEKGLTLEQVREAILAAKATDPKTVTRTSSTTGIDLPEKEAKEYSYSRAILAAVEMAEGKRNVKCLELEVSETLERGMPNNYKRRGGLFIPTSLRAQGLVSQVGTVGSGVTPAVRAAIEQALTRAGTIDSQTANAIKEVVFTEYGGELINILRNLALVVRMGARVLTGLSSPIAFPRQTQDVTATWVPENPGVDVADTNVKTDLVTITPRTLQAATKYSRQLLIQSSVDVEAMVRESIAAAHALAYDLAAIHGTGTNNQPLGLYNQPLVLTVDFSNAAFGDGADHLAWTGVVEMERVVAAANALLGNLGFLTTASIGARGKTTLKFPAAAIAQGGPIWEGTLLEGEMDGVRAMTTNQVSKTLGANGAPSGGTFHGLIFGNWTDLIIGQFGGAMEMIVDPYTLKKQGLIEVASFQMADVAVRHPVSFSVGTNLAP